MDDVTIISVGRIQQTVVVWLSDGTALLITPEILADLRLRLEHIPVPDGDTASGLLLE